MSNLDYLDLYDFLRVNAEEIYISSGGVFAIVPICYFGKFNDKVIGVVGQGYLGDGGVKTCWVSGGIYVNIKDIFDYVLNDKDAWEYLKRLIDRECY